MEFTITKKRKKFLVQYWHNFENIYLEYKIGDEYNMPIQTCDNTKSNKI